MTLPLHLVYTPPVLTNFCDPQRGIAHNTCNMTESRESQQLHREESTSSSPSESEEEVLDSSSSHSDDKNIVINQLLCYVSTYIHCSAPDNIKRLVLLSYSGKQILHAKKMLWSAVQTGILCKYKKRRASPTRPEADADC